MLVKKAKNLEGKLFGEFEIISSDDAKIACHKAILSSKLYSTFLHL